MKARDIIPGWPRGRSTSVAEKWNWIEWPWRIDQDDISNHKYHQDQQAMVTDYLEKPLTEMLFGLAIPFRLSRAEVYKIAIQAAGQRALEEYIRNMYIPLDKCNTSVL